MRQIFPSPISTIYIHSFHFIFTEFQTIFVTLFFKNKIYKQFLFLYRVSHNIRLTRTFSFLFFSFLFSFFLLSVISLLRTNENSFVQISKTTHPISLWYLKTFSRKSFFLSDSCSPNTTINFLRIISFFFLYTNFF